MKARLKSIMVIGGGTSFLIASTYFVLLGCAAEAPAVRPVKKSVSMPVTLSPSGARIDDLTGEFSVDSTNTAHLDWRSACPEKPTTGNFERVVHKGGHVVKITYPGMAAPLYGLLALRYLPRDYNGPASRSYQLQIPQNYVDATEGGRVSVVFEPFDYADGERIAWSLWLSRDPGAFGVSDSTTPDQPHRLGGSKEMK